MASSRLRSFHRTCRQRHHRQCDRQRIGYPVRRVNVVFGRRDVLRRLDAVVGAVAQVGDFRPKRLPVCPAALDSAESVTLTASGPDGN